MNTLVFIGDVHGKISELLALLAKYDDPTMRIFQLGDMALGFPGVVLPRQADRFSFLRGNHDDPFACRAHYNYLGDYGYQRWLRLFFLSGAYSIDWKPRVERMKAGGIAEWWKDEELSIERLEAAYRLYIATKPEIVISHDCPSSIAPLLGGMLFLNSDGTLATSKGDSMISRTAKTLQRMFEFHKPRHWIFGHYHIDKTVTVDGTTFRCCDELHPYELTV